MCREFSLILSEPSFQEPRMFQGEVKKPHYQRTAIWNKDTGSGPIKFLSIGSYFLFDFWKNKNKKRICWGFNCWWICDAILKLATLQRSHRVELVQRLERKINESNGRVMRDKCKEIENQKVKRCREIMSKSWKKLIKWSRLQKEKRNE